MYILYRVYDADYKNRLHVHNDSAKFSTDISSMSNKMCHSVMATDHIQTQSE